MAQGSKRPGADTIEKWRYESMMKLEIEIKKRDS